MKTKLVPVTLAIAALVCLMGAKCDRSSDRTIYIDSYGEPPQDKPRISSETPGEYYVPNEIEVQRSRELARQANEIERRYRQENPSAPDAEYKSNW